MGGAVAMLLAAVLQDSGFIAPAGSSSQASNTCAQRLVIAGVFGFENPKVGDATFASHYTNIGLGSKTLVHVYENDPVPQVPLTPYTHVGALVLTRRSLANPDVTIITGPGPASLLTSSINDIAIGSHSAAYWLPPIRNWVTSTCVAAAAKKLITSCPDFAKIAATVVPPRDEVAEITGTVYYLDNAGVKHTPAGEFDVTCYDYDFATAAALLITDREPMCTTKGSDGVFTCRYHRRIKVLAIFGPWDVITLSLAANPVDRSDKQSWPDIECDIKPLSFPTGTYTGRLTTDQEAVVYDAGAIELNPDRSAACKANGCGPSGDIWLTHIPVEKLVPETWFTRSCANHDCCYASCGLTKKQCDDEFLRNMKWECYQLTSAEERLRCMASALLYHKAVADFGTSAFKSAQIENFCVVSSADTAAISGKVLYLGFEPLANAVVTCYDVDGAVDDLMCMAKTGADGIFKCYYFKKTDGETWDDTPFFKGPDVGCSVKPAPGSVSAFSGTTEVLPLTEDSEEGDINVGTLAITSKGDIYKG